MKSFISKILLLTLSLSWLSFSAAEQVLAQNNPLLPSDYTADQVSQDDIDQLDNAIKNLESNPLQSQAPAGNDFNLDIVWQTDTLVPYDYAGKALPGTFSRLIIYALANRPNPQNLTYTWVIDDISSSRDGPEQKSVGGDTFSFFSYQVPGFIHTVRVTAFDELTGISASATVNIKTQKNESYFYLNRNNSYNSVSKEEIKLVPGDERFLLVRPFYFNADKIDDLKLAWRLDNKPIDNNNPKPEILPLRLNKNSPTGARAALKLEVTNKLSAENYNEKSTTKIYITALPRR